MGDVEYIKVGLKAGLEIHQQLDTGKLFSRTPSLLRAEKPDYTIMRKLHKVAGESGEVDIAVKHEAGLDKEFYYQGYNDSISLVELDEEPPREMDEEALDEAIKIAILLNCELYPVAQIMRKTVIDGSNTSGFQRTVLIGHDGFLETSFGKVGIEGIALEEDAARIVEKDDKKSIYRLDRLGIPLVEISTAPDMNIAEQIKETALKIGEILRACKVKRGIGTIRQDLNISIKGHDRVEIKGFQEPRIMIKTTDLEIERQTKELRGDNSTRPPTPKKKNGEVRNVLDDGTTEFLRPLPGKARMYPETDLPLLKIGRERINRLKKELPKLRSEIRDELKKKGLSDELIILVLDGNLDEFELLLRVYNKDANLIGKMVALWRQEIASKIGKSIDEIRLIVDEKVLERILEELVKGKISIGDIKNIMQDVASGKKVEDAIKIEKMDENEIEEEIRKIVKEKPGLRENAYMGLVMAKMKGKINAQRAMEIIGKIVKEK